MGCHAWPWIVGKKDGAERPLAIAVHCMFREWGSHDSRHRRAVALCYHYRSEAGLKPA